jgi:hypothetical protein
VHSFWIRLRTARGAAAAQHSFSLLLNTSTDGVISVPVSLTVWTLQLPPLTESFGTIFDFPYRSDRDGATDLAKYYGGAPLDKAIKQEYFDMLCEERTPADDPYITDPRPIEDYTMLAACGSPHFNLLDVQSVAGSFVNQSMVYTHAQVEATISALKPIVAAVEAAGLLDRAYVYGFDERPRSYIPAIRQLFGAVKAHFPQVRTVSVLRWPPTADMNVDVWVNLYSLWNSSEAAAFRASAAGREAWAYHCISPRPTGDPPTGPVRFLNTFLEYPPMHPRLLSWWAGAEAVDGWLYYLVNGWGGEDDLRSTFGAPRAYTHEPLRLLPGSSTRTSFSAVRFNGAAVPGDPHAFSNGDGILMYPGRSGPLASTRLERYRDGLEDLELLRAAMRNPAVAKRAMAIVRTVITSFVHDGLPGAGVNATDDPAVLEAAREQLAAELTRAA